MSESSNGPDWWQGTDGKWYPPMNPMTEVPSTSLASKGDRFTFGVKQKAIFGLVTVAVLILLVVFKSGGSTETKTVTGTFSLVNWGCVKPSDFSDINPSTAVVLRDKDGKVLDRTSLGNRLPNSIGNPCKFSFSLEVPKMEGYYALSIGNRGESQYTWDEIITPFSINLSLGGN